MRVKEALKLLDLNEFYTEEELSKAYKIAMFQCHPDLFALDSESVKLMMSDRAQKINEAKEILKQKFKESSQNYKAFYASLINKLAVFTFKKDTLYIYKPLITRTLILKNEAIEQIKVSKSFDSAKSIYEKFSNDLKFLYKSFLLEFNIKRGIKEVVGFNFNFDCSIDDFAEQIEDYEMTYNKHLDNKYVYSINMIVEKYKSRAGYSHISEKVEELRKEALNKLRDIELSENKVVNEFDKKVNSLFKTYFSNKPKYDKLVSLIEKNNLIDLFGKDIAELEENLVESFCFEYFYRVLAFKVNKEIAKYRINAVHCKLIKIAFEKENKLKFSNDRLDILLINEIVYKVSSIMSLILSGELDSENLDIIENLKLENLREEIKKLDLILKKPEEKLPDLDYQEKIK